MTASLYNLANTVAPVNYGLVRWWPFREGAGIRAADLSLYSRTASLSGFGAAGLPPKWVGTGLGFDATGNYVTAGAPLIPASSNFAVSAWVSPVDRSDYRSICGQHATGQAGRFIIEIEITSGQLLAFNGADQLSGLTVPLNQWSHIVVSRKGDVYSFWVNGVRGTDRTSSTALYQGANTVIGNANIANVDPFKGQIASVRIYNRALTEVDVRSLALSKVVGVIDRGPEFYALVAGGVTGAVSITNLGDITSLAGSPQIIGNSAILNNNDSVSINVVTSVTGGIACQSNSDSVTINGSSSVNGTVPISNNDDAINSQAISSVIGEMPVVNSNDTVLVAAVSTSIGTISINNTNDVVSITGSSSVSGDVSVSNSNDNVVIQGSVGSEVVGNISVVNIGDTLNASGMSTIVGTLGVLNTGDAVSSQGASTVSGELSILNFGDVVSIIGSTTVIASIGIVNIGDALTISATPAVIGNISLINNGDIVAIQGSVGDAVTGTVELTTASDNIIILANSTVAGSISVINSSDSISIDGLTSVAGNISFNTQNDIISVQGIVSNFGSISTLNNGDSVSLLGNTSVVGTISVINANDISTSVPGNVFTHPIGATTLIRIGNNYSLTQTGITYTISKL